MHIVGNGSEGEYLLDPLRKIPDAHLSKVCKIRSGHKTCRYIGLTVNGYVCTKNTPMRGFWDKQVELACRGECKFTACGDNCEGIGKLNEAKSEETDNQKAGISEDSSQASSKDKAN